LTAENFAHIFAPELVAGLVSGAVVLGLGYWCVDRRLRLRERADRERELETERDKIRAGALAIVETELKSNAVMLKVWRKALRTPPGVPTPGLDVNGWNLILQGHVLATLSPVTADALMHAYNRIRSANVELERLSDLAFGPSALQLAIARAGGSDAHGALTGPIARLSELFEKFNASRRSALLERIDDLKPYLNDAIDGVERETGRYAGVPARDRDFSLEHPPTRIGAGAVPAGRPDGGGP
jgi:hypothetical protein